MAIGFGSNESVLYLAWNVHIKSADMAYLQRTLDINSLPAILTRQTFPREFFTSKLLACVQFGIPLKPGVPAKAFEADSVGFPVLQFCLLQRPIFPRKTLTGSASGFPCCNFVCFSVE